MLQKIEALSVDLCDFGSDNAKKLMKIIAKNSSNYKKFALGGGYVYHSRLRWENMRPIVLTNAMDIKFSTNVYVAPISFTKNCQALEFSSFAFIGYQFCKMLVDDCDLSNIKRLKISGIDLLTHQASDQEIYE